MNRGSGWNVTVAAALTLGPAVWAGACASAPPVGEPQPPVADVRQEDSSPAASSVLAGIYTVAQATRGEGTFQERCAVCHSPHEFTGAGFQRAWANRTMQDLYDMVSSSMPLDNPGSLSAQQYTDVLTFLLRQNNYPTGSAELAADPVALRAVRIEPLP